VCRAAYTLSHCHKFLPHCHKFLRDQHELSIVDRDRRIEAICKLAAASDLEWRHHRIQASRTRNGWRSRLRGNEVA